MADVMPYCIGRYYALADVIAMYVVVGGKPQRQMLLPNDIKVADVITIHLFCGRW